MEKLNLPQHNIRLKNEQNEVFIFDHVRKKWLVCTPEEWVRQHFLGWLIAAKGFSASNLAIEAGLKLNALQKRTDIVAFKHGVPTVLVECKAPHIKLSQKTFDQLLRYNHQIQAPYVVVTNGLQHIFAQYSASENKLFFLREMPEYAAL